MTKKDLRRRGCLDHWNVSGRWHSSWFPEHIWGRKERKKGRKEGGGEGERDLADHSISSKGKGQNSLEPVYQRTPNYAGNAI